MNSSLAETLPRASSAPNTREDLALVARRLAVMRELVAETVLLFGPDGTMRELQAPWVALTGQADPLGERWLECVHPEDHERSVHHWRRGVARGVPFEETLRLRCVGGDYRGFTVRAAPVNGPGTDLAEWVVVLLEAPLQPGQATPNANVLRELEDLRRRATTLEATVESRTAALRETIGELEAFSYRVSHDMRAPLRAMQGFSKILAEEYADALSPGGKEYIRRINTAAARLDGLIQGVLSYSKVTRMDQTLQPVDLGALLDDLIRTSPPLQPPAAHVEIIGDLPWVLAIPAVLTQCLSNLLGNAVKFVDSGTVPRVEIWATPLPAERRVRISFRDNGFGIDAEAHQDIFGVFQRLSKSFEGAGMGLAIVKKGAERLGGAVGLESEPGKGSTFWLDLQTPGD